MSNNLFRAENVRKIPDDPNYLTAEMINFHTELLYLAKITILIARTGILIIRMMSRLIRSIAVLCLLYSAVTTRAQVTTRISTPQLEVQNEKLVISYQIVNGTDAENYRIWIEVTNAANESVDARSLSGDVGASVRGGGTRYIVWDYRADGVSLESGIYVQVMGEREIPPTVTEEPVVREEDPNNASVLDAGASISRGGMLFRSALFPGWGIAAARQGSAHWIMGVAGYGCLASSVALHFMARNDYDAYLGSNDAGEFNRLYDQAILKDNLSEYTAYAAIGIWIVDLAWTALADRPRGLHFGAVIDPRSRAPLITLKYGF